MILAIGGPLTGVVVLLILGLLLERWWYYRLEGRR